MRTESREPVVVVSEDLSGDATRWLADRCRVLAVRFDSPHFADALREAEALLVRTYTTVSAALVERAPNLRVVGRGGAGLDNIDVGACRARGIEVVYTPDANTQAVVEYVLFLIGDALRPRVPVAGAVDMSEWTRLRSAHPSRQLDELTVGILGLGRIGSRVGHVAGSVGAAVIFHDLLEIPPEIRRGAEPVTAPELFERSDILTVHVDGRTGNRGFVSSHLVDRMKADAIFINTSRGFVVDNVALARFLRAHPSSQAHLDVHDPEPFDDACPLLGLPNARLYPHLGSRTRAALKAMDGVVRDVVAVLDGRPPRFPAPIESIAEPGKR